MTTTKCSACGADVKTTMRFCAACGAQTDQGSVAEAMDAVEPTPSHGIKFKLNSKKLTLPAIIGAAVLAAIIVAVSILTPSKYVFVKGSVYIEQSDGYVVVIPHGKPRVEIDGYFIDSARSLDGTVAAVLIRDTREETNRIYDNNLDMYVNVLSNYSLYIVTDKPHLIADDAYPYFSLSAAGNAIAYIKANNFNDGTLELWHYSGGNNTWLSSDFNFNGGLAISPDGKTVAFTNSDGVGQTGCVWDGRTTELGRDIQPIAVSNGAKYIYYVRNDAFFVQRGIKGDNRERLGDASDVDSIKYANVDLSQIVYGTAGRYFISSKGGSRQPLSGSITRFVMPSVVASQQYKRLVICGISSFADTFYLNQDSSVVHISRKYETNNVARGVNNVYLASDGKTLTFLRNRSIYKVNGTNAKANPTEIVVRDAAILFATADGKGVFFVNEFSELYYQKSKGRPSLVSDHLAARGGIGLFKGNTLFYVSDSELYVSTGGKGKAVSGIDGQVQSVSVGPMYVTVAVHDYGDSLVYISTDGKAFEVVNQSQS